MAPIIILSPLMDLSIFLSDSIFNICMICCQREICAISNGAGQQEIVTELNVICVHFMEY